jgi:hypothetical protein
MSFALLNGPKQNCTRQILRGLEGAKKVLWLFGRPSDEF